MDPVTLALLAAGGLSGVQGIIQSTANNPLQQRNREELDKLLALEQSGGLGLTPTQQRTYSHTLMDPVRQAAAAARSQNEQLQTALGGSSSGADLSRLRQEEQRQVGGAAQNAALQLAALNEAAMQGQKREIEQRTALKSGLREDDTRNILGGLAAAGGALGAAAGVPPGGNQLYGLFGQAARSAAPAPAPAPDPLAELSKNLPTDQYRMVLEWAARNPGELEKLIAEVRGG